MRTVCVALVCVAAVLTITTEAFGQTWDWAAQIANYSTTSVPLIQVSAVTVDQTNNIYIAGTYGDSALLGVTKLKATPVGDDMFLAKLNNSGQYSWAKSFGSGDGSDQLFDVTHDPDGNIYVCGYFSGQIVLDTFHVNSNSISNVILAKYNSSGNVLWARLVWHAQQGPGGLVCDHGYVYAAVNHTLAKYTSDGDTVWTRTAADNVSVPVEYSDIAVDSSGNLYVSGEYTGQITYGATTLHAASITDRDVLILKYDSLGNVIWAKGAGAVSSPIQEDVGRGIAVASSGYIFVVGQFKGTAKFEADSVISGGASSSLFVAKYDGGGNLQWVKGGNGTTGSSSKAYNVRVLTNDDILIEATVTARVTVADTTINFGGGSDVVMLRLASDGSRRWAKRSETFAPAIWGYGMDINSNATSAYAGGQFAGSATFGPTTLNSAGGSGVPYDGYVGKMTLSAITDAPDASDLPVPKSSALSQNYPNPFNPSTTIGYALSAPARVRITIYNLLGQEVNTLVNHFEPAGIHSVVWDGRNSEGAAVSSGMYYYRLTAGDYTESKKMVLLK